MAGGPRQDACLDGLGGPLSKPPKPPQRPAQHGDDQQQQQSARVPVLEELFGLSQGLRVSVNDVQLELFERIGEGSFGTVYRGGCASSGTCKGCVRKLVCKHASPAWLISSLSCMRPIVTPMHASSGL